MSYDIDTDAEMVNLRFAIIPIAGETMAVRTDRERLEFFSRYSFSNFVVHPKKRTAKGALIGRGTNWWNYEGRRQYDGMRFEPGSPEVLDGNVFNSWRGWGVEPKEGSCPLYLALLRDIICNENLEHYEYLLNWMADAIQRPGDLPGIAVALRSGQGTGKGLFATHFGALFGVHFAHISQPEQIYGKFNAHLVESVLAFADESFFAGDARHASVLKAMITEPTQMLERKGVDAVPVKNCTHLILSSNNDWIIPAGHDERRWFVLDVSEAHKQEKKYYEPIDREMKSGGREALLHMLLHRDLTGANIRDVPKTEALADQKLHSARGMDSFIMTICETGILPSAHGVHHDIMLTGEHDVMMRVRKEADGEFHYVDTMTRDPGAWARLKREYRDARYSTPAVLKAELVRWGFTEWRSKNARGLRAPPIAELRAKYEAKHGPHSWPEEVVDWGPVKSDEEMMKAAIDSAITPPQDDAQKPAPSNVTPLKKKFDGLK
jgi:hypothetical protein